MTCTSPRRVAWRPRDAPSSRAPLLRRLFARCHCHSVFPVPSSGCCRTRTQFVKITDTLRYDSKRGTCLHRRAHGKPMYPAELELEEHEVLGDSLQHASA